MSRLLDIAITAALTLGLATAQDQRNQGKSGMMGGGMGMMGEGMGMMGMMQDPVHQSVFTVFALPEMQAELGLSAQQVTQLRQYKQELLTKGRELSAQISAKQKELQEAVAGGSSKTAEVKQLLEQVASFRADLEFAAFDTAGKMKAALTDPQRTKLAAMRPGEMHQAMMAHITVAEMTEMMQFMGGDAGMMRGGMMGMMGMMGGMMMDGMMGTRAAPPKQ
jgi:hypothetical protein